LTLSASRGDFSALETLRIVIPVLDAWRTTSADAVAPFVFRSALRKYDTAIALLNATTCNFMIGESFALLEAVIAANRANDTEGAGEVDFTDTGPGKIETASMLMLANRMTDSIEALRRAGETSAYESRRGALVSFYSSMLVGEPGTTPAVTAALPRFGLLLAAEKLPDLNQILKLAEQSLDVASRDWRSALLAAHALKLAGHLAESREMALLALALTEEEERASLQRNDHGAANAARRIRDDLRASFEPISAMTPAEIGRASKGIDQLHERGSLPSAALVKNLAASR
jgi:hypothetical protein